MTIKNLQLPQTACLAPMAGVADRAFREICVEWGACYTVGEMSSSKGMMYGSKKTEEYLEVYPNERPMAVQIFGDDPKIMAEAAVKAMKYSPDAIDINMGCPAPKIVGSGSGSALMKSPELAGKIVGAVKSAVDVPVTVKFRKGWDDSNINAVEFAQILEFNGADAITIHGRTRTQMYAPPVDIDIIKAVKNAVKIPVIANGDIIDAITAKEMYEKTQCDLVMVGRGALGSPWIFKQIEYYLKTGNFLPEPTIEEKMQVMLKHIRLVCEYKGEYVALKESRKHCAWYLKGVRGAAEFRNRCSQISKYEDLKKMTEEILLIKDL
ncbi:MAG: tRNA dihydrouridine synthase DusB [Oscillospiraceae bacterium]